MRGPARLALRAAAVVAAAGCAVSPRAWTQDAESNEPSASTELSEILVSAERRTTDLQKTPLALTTVSAQSLDQSFITEISGLNGIVPGLETTHTSGFENIVTIRGIGSETPENAPTTVSGVSEFIDGVYIANTISLDQSLFDIDHIEVLRGPQGALYGQSSIGGAISIVTKQPQLRAFDGTAAVDVGNYDLHRERGVINLPLGDMLALRLSAQKYDHQGFTVNEALPDFRQDDAHDTAVKAALLFKPSQAFEATVTGQWYQAQQNGAAQKNIRDPEASPRQLYQDYPSQFDLTTQLYHLNLQYDFPAFSIKSVTADQILNHRQQEDSSRSAYSLIGSYDDVAEWNTVLHNFNQELDFLSAPGASLEWIGGGFFLYQTSSQVVAEFEGTDSHPNLTVAPDIESAPPANLPFGDDDRVLRRSYSGFAQTTYHAGPRLRFTLGGRYNEDSYSLKTHDFSQFGVDDVARFSKSHVSTGRVQTDFDLAPDNMIYASIARGYKPGGVNGAIGQAVVPDLFKSETNTAYEVGSKNAWLDRALHINAAGFYYVYHDMQYLETDPVPFKGGVDNIPSVHVWGAELEANYRTFSDRLRIGANLSLESGRVEGSYRTIDSTVANTIENGPSGPCSGGGAFYNPVCFAEVIAAARDLRGNKPPALPAVSGSINASYALTLPWGVLTPRLEYIYRGSEWARVFNEPALDRVPAYGVTNGNLEYVPAAAPHTTLSASVTNAFDVAGVNSRYTDPYGTGQTSQQFIPPLQYIFAVRCSF